MTLLREFGTVTFDRDFMRGSIVMDGSELQLGRWLALVPEVYREIAERTAARVAERYIGEWAGARKLDDIIDEIQAECVRALRTDPRPRVINHTGDPVGHLAGFGAHVVEGRPAAGPWISVADRKPTHTGPVLVEDAEDGHHIAQWFSGLGEWLSSDGGRLAHVVRWSEIVKAEESE